MSRFVTFFLAALVLIHATFGCCVHHAHSCEVGCCDWPAAVAAACPCDEHEHDEEGVPVSQGLTYDSNHDHDSHRCEDDPCTFVTTRSSDRDFEYVGGKASRMTFFVADAVAEIPASIAAEQRESADVASTAPRLHLLLSVLLI